MPIIMVDTPPNVPVRVRSAALPETVVIIGASGFIGQNLVQHLKGRVRRILPVSSNGVSVFGIPGIPVDQLLDADVGPGTVVVNLAAFRYDAANFSDAQAQTLLRNVEILGRVYEFCTRKGIDEIRSAGSIAVYPADETNFDDARPIDLNRAPHEGELMYAWSKRIGEIYGRLFEREYRLNTVTFRLTNPFGPYDSLDAAKAHVVPAFIIRALTTSGSFTVRGNPDASRDFIFVRDVCEVIYRSLAWRGVVGAYNLGSGENVTIRQLARTIMELVGIDLDIVSAGSPVSSVSIRRCGSERLRSDFGMDRFTRLRDGLVPTIEWYRHAIGTRC